MMNMYGFILNILPTAQARPRFTGRGFAYKSKEQRANEDTLAACLLPYKPTAPFEGALCVTIFANFPVPKSTSKKKAKEMLEGKIHPTKKPDADNVAKNLLDAMTRLQFWRDDVQVTTVICRKRYAELASIGVQICSDYNK